MGEAKPMASLSSTLLARKGQAKPAMRPQGFAGFGFGGAGNGHGHEDLGWNDMGHDLTPVAYPAAHAAPPSAEIVSLVPSVPEPMYEPEASPEPPAVVRQQEELAREIAIERLPAAIFARAAPGSKGRAAFTLRLDPDRHLRLRLSCAVTHRSAQSIVIEALDAFLNQQPAVDELARTGAVTNER